MKNLALTLLLTLPLSTLAYSDDQAPICPSAEILKTTPVSYTASQIFNEPVTVLTSENKYGSDHIWSMKFIVSAVSLESAVNKAKKSFSALSFEFGPHYYQNKWVCNYQVNEPGILKVTAETNSN